MVAYATIITDILRHVKERAENGLKKRADRRLGKSRGVGEERDEEDKGNK